MLVHDFKHDKGHCHRYILLHIISHFLYRIYLIEYNFIAIIAVGDPNNKHNRLNPKHDGFRYLLA